MSVLQDAADLGFLGPGPIEPHVRHAAALRGADCAPTTACSTSVPAAACPGWSWRPHCPMLEVVLLDARTNRTDFLSGRSGGWAGLIG